MPKLRSIAELTAFYVDYVADESSFFLFFLRIDTTYVDLASDPSPPCTSVVYVKTYISEKGPRRKGAVKCRKTNEKRTNREQWFLVFELTSMIYIFSGTTI